MSGLGGYLKGLRPAPQAPAFRAWFDGSVVTTPEGAPRIVYHGTRSPLDFEGFETGCVRDEEGELLHGASGDPGAYLGPHFTEDQGVANRFAEGRAAEWDRKRWVSEGEAGARVLPVYLAIRRPRVFASDEELIEFLYEHGSSRYLEDLIQFKLDAGDLEELPDGTFVESEEELSKGALYLRLHNELRYQEPGDSDPVEEVAEELGSSVRQMLLDQGYDGVRYSNTIEGGGWAWIAFEASQAKAAYGNAGAWRADSPSILENPRRSP